MRECSRSPTILASRRSAAVVALALLVDGGHLASLDRFARDHCSPLQAGPLGRGRGELLQLIGGATDAMISAAGIAVSLLLMTLAARRLVANGRRRTAMLWAAALTLAFVVELVGKALVNQSRPDSR